MCDQKGHVDHDGTFVTGREGRDKKRVFSITAENKQLGPCSIPTYHAVFPEMPTNEDAKPLSFF
jgi:hypothetical protein